MRTAAPCTISPTTSRTGSPVRSRSASLRWRCCGAACSEPSLSLDLDPDFAEFFECLARHSVRYLVVGGYALAAHGLPRATGDLDVWVMVDPANARNVMQALVDFGFGDVGLSEDDFLGPNQVVQLGYPPYRIDILTAIDGVAFEQAWERRITVASATSELDVIGRDDLIANKLASGRPRDRDDVERILRGSDPGV